MGDGAVGCSLSLVAPAEDKMYARIIERLETKFESVNLDSRLLRAAQERVNLACRVVEAEEVERKSQRSNQWFKEKADEAGLKMDDDLLEEGLAGGDERDRSKLRQAVSARAQLRSLLAEPMQAQRYGKFLSTNSAVGHRVSEPTVASIPVGRSNERKKRRRR